MKQDSDQAERPSTFDEGPSFFLALILVLGVWLAAGAVIIALWRSL